MNTKMIRTPRMRWAPLLLASVLFSLLLAVLPAHAAGPWYVGPGGSDGYDCLSVGTACETIAAAIAKASDGDTINIAAGTYAESLTVPVALHFVGDGAATTILDGGGTNRIFEITGSPVTLQGFTLRNGYADTYGGAIKSSADLTLTAVSLVSNTVVANFGGNGGGAVLVVGNLLVTDSYFGQNRAIAGSDLDADAGALWVDGNLTISNSQFISNTADDDNGAIEVLTGAVQIGNSQFQGNQALGDRYGVLEVESGSLWITASQFLSNTSAGNDGAIYAYGPATVSDSLFQSNSAGGYVGALEAKGALNVTDSAFIGNRSVAEVGAIYGASNVEISDSLFRENTSGDYGGAMEVAGVLTITNTDFISNTAAADTGALYARGGLAATNTRFIGNTSNGDDNYGNGAGAIYAYNADVTLIDSLFQENQAAGGFDVGAFYAYDVVVTISNTSFISNTATGSRGAIRVEAYQGSPEVHIASSLFQGNVANVNSGALDVDNLLTMRDTRLIGNRADGGDGGAIRLNGNGELQNILLERSAATGLGAAIHVVDATSLRIVHTTVASPTVGPGAAIYIASGIVKITDTIITSYTTGIENAGGTTIEDYNLFFGNTTDKSGASGGTHDVVGNPRFVNPQGGNYRVRSGSPALGGGIDVGVTRDIAGDLRSNPPTIGAYEKAVADPTLSALALSIGPLYPSFISSTFAYTGMAAYPMVSTVVTATATQPGDGITVTVTPAGGAETACPGTPAICPLAVGANGIAVTVTTAGGTSQRYTVAVTRAEAGVTAVNDAAGTLQGNALVLLPLANDLDPAGGGLSVTAVTQPAHGTVSIDPGNQTVTYTPDPAFSGLDRFTYTARDTKLSTDEATVAVVVTPHSETDRAPIVAPIDPAQQGHATFTDTHATTTLVTPVDVYTGTLTAKDIFYLVYTPIITPTSDVHQEPGGFTFGGFIFDLNAYLNDQHLPGYVFPEPITLTIRYDLALLNGLVENSLVVYYWNGTSWDNDGITLVSRNPTDHTITLRLAHLSELAFFASAPTGTPPENEPGAYAAHLYLPAIVQQEVTAAEEAPPVEIVLEGPSDGAGIYLPAVGK